MATIGNKNEATFSDGSGPSGDVLNIDTADGIVQIGNGKTLAFYSDAYATLTGQVKNGVHIQPTSGATGAALATSGTISTTNLGITKVAPTAAVTAIVFGTGTTDGQPLTVVNEGSAGSYTITPAAATTSNVADGTASIISGLRCANYIWDAGSSLWYRS